MSSRSVTKKRLMLVGMDGLQLCQVGRFASEGSLPNLKELLEVGASGELLPELPAWTPTNWGTIATGALPGSTMLSGWHRRQDRDLEGTWDFSTFSSRACPVETIWEAAERAGVTTLSIFYPLTWPPRTKTGMVVAPLYDGPGVIPFDISSGRLWSTVLKDSEYVTVPQTVEPIAVQHENGRLVAHTAIAPSAIGLAREFNFGDRPKEARQEVAPGDSVAVKISFDPSTNTACIEAGGETLTAERGTWTRWLTLDFGPRGKGSVRFYLFSCNPDSEYGLTLAHSSVYPTEGFAYPDELCGDLIKNVGPFLASPIRPPGEEGDSVYLADYEYQGLWMARAAKRLLETRGWQLYYQHHHVVDSATHHWLNQADPQGGGYDPDSAPRFVDLMRRAYVVADKIVGEFMSMMDEHTVLMVLSDHGNIPIKWGVDYPRVLEAAGLLTRDKDGRIVWEQTRAFMIPQRVTDIYVNLKGRFPRGIVGVGDYGRVQEEIIDALLDLRNPDGGRVVAYALRKADAQVVGYDGPECGDVVFVFNSYHGAAVWGVEMEFPEGQAVIRAKRGANHGTQIATTRTGFSSDLAAAIIAGPGIKKGYARDDKIDGLWKLIDVVPTVSHVMGFPPPKGSRGGIMYDIFE